MNYLELCQKLALKVGASPPTTTVSQTGNSARLTLWINEAWNEIQTSHKDWGWMRASASFVTVAGQGIYPLGTGSGFAGISIVGQWIPYSFRNYPTTVGNVGEITMDYIDYDIWRDAYEINSLRYVQTRPMVASVSPENSICLGPFPNGDYTITADYYTAPTDLSDDADIPALPTEYHWAIIYKAMMLYGAYESAPEVYDEGMYNFRRFMRRLEAAKMPPVWMAGSLA